MKDETVKPVILYVSFIAGWMMAESWKTTPNFHEALLVSMISGIVLVLVAWWFRFLK